MISQFLSVHHCLSCRLPARTCRKTYFHTYIHTHTYMHVYICIYLQTHCAAVEGEAGVHQALEIIMTERRRSTYTCAACQDGPEEGGGRREEGRGKRSCTPQWNCFCKLKTVKFGPTFFACNATLKHINICTWIRHGMNYCTNSLSGLIVKKRKLSSGRVRLWL